MVNRRTRFALFAAVVVGALALVSSALASPPANDSFIAATEVDASSLPFSDSTPVDEATLELGEPTGCYNLTKSTWYTIAPASSGTFRVDISGSSFVDRIVNVYREDAAGLGGLSFLGCASPYYNGQSSLTFHADAGKRYYIQTGGMFPWTFGTLALNITAVLPPANDDFAGASRVGSLPYQDDVDTTAATVQSGEPSLCTPPPSEKTVWYAYTPAASGSVTAAVTSAPAPTGIAAYTGSTLSGLTQLACQYGFSVTTHVDAGTTYWFQVGTFGQIGGQLRFTLSVPPPPNAGFYFSPFDPSSIDTVSFQDTSFDPANAGFSAETWSFGDGASVTNPPCCGVSHRYAADGDYTVKLTVTTRDGRTASTSQVVHIRTHDVGIAKLTVPNSASVGQTKQITVGIVDARYQETVQVQLFRSTPGGFQVVGTLVQTIAPQNGSKTTPYSFNYTFVADDAAAGKVTFQAVATILGARDALPGDNTVIALPTAVH